MRHGPLKIVWAIPTMDVGVRVKAPVSGSLMRKITLTRLSNCNPHSRSNYRLLTCKDAREVHPLENIRGVHFRGHFEFGHAQKRILPGAGLHSKNSLVFIVHSEPDSIKLISR